MSAESLTKCCGFLTLSSLISHFAECHENRLAVVVVVGVCRLRAVYMGLSQSTVRQQQCVVSLVRHLILSGYMIPLCGTLSEWWLAVWLSGNALASINVVALRQTRLVLGWVTVCGRVNHFGM